MNQQDLASGNLFVFLLVSCISIREEARAMKSFNQIYKSKGKKLYLILFYILILMLISAYQAKASHLMASDIQWQCLGDSTYRITIAIYRDCNGQELIHGSRININGINCDFNRSVVAIMASPVDITPVCAGICTRCTRPCNFPYGIQKILLTTIVDFSDVDCCQFEISWRMNARNGIITTGMANQYFFISAMLDICNAPCNNSPVFTNMPIGMACINQCIIYNQGVTDVEDDSLVYSFTPPLSNSTISGSYLPPFSFTRPLYFDGFPIADHTFNQTTCLGFHLDSMNGDLKFKPTQSQVTVMAIKVEEFRNGLKIGEIRRDFQLIIMQCPANDIPVLSGINGTSQYSVATCPGQQICFDIYSEDEDVDDSLTMSWNNGIPGGIFTSTTAKRPEGKFCWTPNENHVRQASYYFTVNLKDNACPLVATTASAFSVSVKPALAIQAPNDICAGSNINFQTDATHFSAIQWESSGNGTFTFVDSFTGTYEPSQAEIDTGFVALRAYSADSSICLERSDETIINIHPIPEITFTSDGEEICSLPLKVQFRSEGKISRGSISSYAWDFGDGQQSTAAHPQIIYEDPDIYSVNLEVVSDQNCSAANTIDIRVRPVGTIKLDAPKEICADNKINFSAEVSHLDSLHWESSGSGTFAFIDNFTGTYEPSPADIDTGSVKLRANSEGRSGCPMISEELIIDIHPIPEISIAYDGDVSCSVPRKLQFINETFISRGSISSYEWDFGDGQFSTETNPAVIYEVPGLYTLRLKVTSDHNCTAEYIHDEPFRISVPPVAAFDADPERTSIVYPQINFINNSTQTIDPEFEWNFGDYLTGDGGRSKEFEPQYSYRDTGQFRIQLVVINSNGCEDTAYQEIYIYPELLVYIPNIFSPNGLGPHQNEVFRPSVFGAAEYLFQVYNRWGEKLFESNDQEMGWNGNFKGHPCPENSFLYVLRIKDIEGKSYRYTGTVTVIR
ncbi:MAG: PKD domain-containing protein [Bacteroidia bacterium]